MVIPSEGIFTMTELPNLIVSDGQGKVFDVPELEMVGMSLTDLHLPSEEDLIPLPSGSDLFELPDRIPLGYDRKRDQVIPLPEYEGIPVIPVAAFMAPAHTQIYRAAYQSKGPAPLLPLFAYTAVGWRDGGFWAAGRRVDPDIRQDFDQWDFDEIKRQAERTLETYPGNRLVEHLVNNCVRRYGCPAARNFVLRRWEAPVPTSPVCNARCLGCLSLQPKSRVPSPQHRITFVPTPEEIAEFTIPHLQHAPRAIISFGQGCEGEPLLQAPVLEEAIRLIRKATDRGTINLNTNGSFPQAVERLCIAGLDSIRVSLNSAQPTYYNRYFRPRTYAFEEVVETLKVMRTYNRWASINYFIFPGFTDHPQEIAALLDLIEQTQLNFIQMRNLNMDPEWYIRSLKIEGLSRDYIGILRWMETVQSHFPTIRFGYFNPSSASFAASAVRRIAHIFLET